MAPLGTHLALSANSARPKFIKYLFADMLIINVPGLMIHDNERKKDKMYSCLTVLSSVRRD